MTSVNGSASVHWRCRRGGPGAEGRLCPDACDGAPCRAADDPRRPTAAAHIVVAFADGLRELGHMEGRNVMFEYRWAEGQPERFAPMAADLVRQPVEILPGPPLAGGFDPIEAPGMIYRRRYPRAPRPQGPSSRQKAFVLTLEDCPGLSPGAFR